MVRWYWSFGSRVPDPSPWVLILDYAEKQWEGEKKSVLNKTKTFNFKFALIIKCRSLYILCFDTLTNNLTLILVFLDETSEGMFLLYLLELAKTAYLKAYGNYPVELFHVKKFSSSKGFRRSMVEVLQISMHNEKVNKLNKFLSFVQRY